ncbi:prepilin-type N-terminal cleavage/methylation domain-containing protein [Candidatus Gracilibacteria bacterium]|nr:prepilin-type N-terminal cleavage/methylation domain-containing protein [Candidatus Gracilibacteria bacterium]
MNKKNKAFTIVELLVAISIISIIALGANNISFKSISDKQSLEIFNNKIISEIERIRNNSLIGKGIGVNLDVPKTWRIDFSTSGSGVINTNYRLTDSSPWVLENSIPMEKFSINGVSCVDVNGTEHPLNNTQTGSIIFEGGKYRLSGTCLTTQGSLKINSFNRGYDYNIEFDVVSGIIKR